jgi:hypothetical protein
LCKIDTFLLFVVSVQFLFHRSVDFGQNKGKEAFQNGASPVRGTELLGVWM